MKKIIIASLFASLFTSVGAFAEVTDVDLEEGALAAIGDTDTDINLARQYRLVAIDDRDGFVKNSFEITLSANVVAGAVDNSPTSRFGVVAGSNKGYNVFTGSSVGGSVSQCGPQLEDKTTDDLAASLVVGDTLDLALPNGCGIE